MTKSFSIFRFDNELGMAQEDAKEEKQMREKLQRERDTLVSEKYSLEQTVQNLKMDNESSQEKADRLDKELNDILVSGKDNSEVKKFDFIYSGTSGIRPSNI